LSKELVLVPPLTEIDHSICGWLFESYWVISVLFVVMSCQRSWRTVRVVSPVVLE
jgi:hypothetical protein